MVNLSNHGKMDPTLNMEKYTGQIIVRENVIVTPSAQDLPGPYLDRSIAIGQKGQLVGRFLRHRGPFVIGNQKVFYRYSYSKLAIPIFTRSNTKIKKFRPISLFQSTVNGMNGKIGVLGRQLVAMHTETAHEAYDFRNSMVGIVTEQKHKPNMIIRQDAQV